MSFKDEVVFSFEATKDTFAEDYQVVKINDKTRLLRFYRCIRNMPVRRFPSSEAAKRICRISCYMAENRIFSVWFRISCTASTISGY